MQVIIFKNSEGGVSVIYPTPDALAAYGIEAIAQKDVPAGTAYLIVDASVIPEDRTFRAAWEADFTNPDGYGIGAEAWFAEQAAKENK